MKKEKNQIEIAKGMKRGETSYGKRITVGLALLQVSNRIAIACT